MKISINKYLLFVLLTLFAACDPDSFEQVVEIDIPEHESKLAVSANFALNDDNYKVFVSRSLSIENNTDPAPIDNATVKLFENDNEVLQFLWVNSAYQEWNELIPGAKYRLEVQHADYETAVAEAIMPDTCRIIDVELQPNGIIDQEGYEADEIIVRFEDIAPDDNYYYFNTYLLESYFDGNDTIYYKNYLGFIDTYDALAVKGYSLGDLYSDKLLLKDEAFQGDEYEFRFFDYYLTDSGAEYLVVEIHSITEKMYQFMQSLKAYEDNIENPFAEPVTVVNNIENGYGIFGLSAMTQFKLKLN